MCPFSGKIRKLTGVCQYPSFEKAHSPFEIHKFGVSDSVVAWNSLGPCMDSSSKVAALKPALQAAVHGSSAYFKWLLRASLVVLQILSWECPFERGVPLRCTWMVIMCHMRAEDVTQLEEHMTSMFKMLAPIASTS